jgi:hypothetical protein
MLLDGRGDIDRYQTWDQVTLKPLGRLYRYARQLDAPGIFRLTLSSRFFFQQLYLQVSWLDAVVKTDGALLLIWGSSYNDTLPPPYDLSLFRSDGNNIKAVTDSSGLYSFVRHREDFGSRELLKVLLKKKGHFAVVPVRVSCSAEAHEDWFLDIHTDRYVYAPEHRVHFQGIVKKMTDRGYVHPETE